MARVAAAVVTPAVAVALRVPAVVAAAAAVAAVTAAAVAQSEHAAAAADAAAVVADVAVAHMEQILWRWLDAKHLMMHVVVSVAEHFHCLKHNTHNGERLVVVVTICTQPTLKKIISLEQNLNKCRVLTQRKGRGSICPAGRMFTRSANVCKI